MNVALIGYGKMGKAIEEILIREEDTVFLKIQSTNIDEFTVHNLQKCSIAIEFSAPELATKNIMKCIDAGIPVVCGTTGWYAELPAIMEYCRSKEGRFLYAPNFSIGVNLFFEIVRQSARMMASHSDYQLLISETHHTEKKDAPSGTAIQLAKIIIESNPSYASWISGGVAKENEIPVISYREAGVPGTHIIEYTSEADVIKLSHVAKSRQGFAAGAVKAAKWLLGQKPGIYTMKDVLQLK